MIDFSNYYKNSYWFLFVGECDGGQTLISTEDEKFINLKTGNYFEATILDNNVFLIISKGNSKLKKGSKIEIDRYDLLKSYKTEKEVIQGSESVFRGYIDPETGESFGKRKSADSFSDVGLPRKGSYQGT